ncbi:MAG TPA: hypothetical protein VK327_07210, partial [Candidatus Paceibacterota bacterium]|nr:hypothetical protein [Candidatus Paceibacterota bacterium]
MNSSAKPDCPALSPTNRSADLRSGANRKYRQQLAGSETGAPNTVPGSNSRRVFPNRDVSDPLHQLARAHG